MRKLFTFLIFAFAALASYGENLGKFHRGTDSLVFVYEPLAEKPILLYYYIPTSGNVENMPVLFSFHGAERLGAPQIDIWKDFAERDGFIVLAPQFSKEYYNENQYQFGNVFTTRKCKTLNPENKWTYSTIEPMLEFMQKETGNKAPTYRIFGHSGGAQFVHRYLIAKPDARVEKAVAANPGSWTWISDDGSVNGFSEDVTWPYTLKNTPFNNERNIKAYLARNFVVQLGNADTLTSGAGLPTAPASLAQGASRFERGQNYFQTVEEYAQEHGYTFSWKKVIVKGVGHRGKSMVYARSKRDASGVRQYSIDNIYKTGAYSILFVEN